MISEMLCPLWVRLWRWPRPWRRWCCSIASLLALRTASILGWVAFPNCFKRSFITGILIALTRFRWSWDWKRFEPLSLHWLLQRLHLFSPKLRKSPLIAVRDTYDGCRIPQNLDPRGSTVIPTFFSSPAYAETCLRLQVGQWGARYSLDPALFGTQKYSAYSALHRACR